MMSTMSGRAEPPALNLDKCSPTLPHRMRLAALIVAVLAFPASAMANTTSLTWGGLKASRLQRAALGQVTELSGVAPEAFTSGTEATGATTAVVEGTVIPSGEATTYYAQYDTVGSTFCNSEGVTTDGTTVSTPTPPGTPIGSDTTSHEVSVSLAGLAAGEEYCAQIVAVNPSGTALGGIQTFTAGLPAAFTASARSTGATTAVLEGTVTPSGQTTTYYAQYDTVGSTFCNSEGVTTDGTTVSTPAAPGTPLAFVDTASHDVSVDIVGLTAGTAYCAQIVAVHPAGTVFGGTQTFTAGLPTAFTSSAQATGVTTATVAGTINPSGQLTTDYVQYDTVGSTFCDTDGVTTDGTTVSIPMPPGTTVGSDTTDHNLTVDLAGLTAGTSYCAQIVAVNPAGTALGGTQTFTAGLPTAFTSSAQATGVTTATVAGTVNPSGQLTTDYAQYDTVGSTFCDTDGVTTDGTTVSTPMPPGTTVGSDATVHNVIVDLTGLTAGTSYCAQIVAVNPAGTALGGTQTFTAGLPTAFTSSAQATGVTTATVAGTVNPSGQLTTDYVQYDTVGSTFCDTDGVTTDGTTVSIPMPPGTTVGSDTTDHNLTVDLAGLTAGTSYCAQIVAVNPAGTALGGTQTFTAGLPTAFTSSAQATGVTTATVAGTVNPSGQLTTDYAQYDTVGSTFCDTDGVTTDGTTVSTPAAPG